MTSLDLALPRIFQNEGGYSNVEGDTGGETYIGISRNNWPAWEGWALVDANKPLKNNEFIDNLDLESLVGEFYDEKFWKTNHLGEIDLQDVATKLLDMAVNMGSYRAGLIVQQSLANDFRIGLDIDGHIGEQTIQAINKAGITLLNRLRARSVDFYMNLANEHPTDEKFLNNWLARARQ